ncbi:uncharacterized protein PAC_16240 [Phialocephala subalpina]|uniref:Heterokaryon incompatibility domain-containing protein n=1 Tax=Phialocephala subalpina TaxID=576137 RepID=A0A1L7XMS6_9HELO|nr:uncharacterized protein PAC_16240 [Phialocephala subalpina]
MPARRSKLEATFHHRRLSSPRSIRLLGLLPSPEFQSTLDVNLTEVSLDAVTDEHNNYEALSYVWGSRSGTESIRCDDKLHLVTPNCQSALRHLRLRDKIRILWVDAICIDQENGAASVEERNSQVALMGEIYKTAVQKLREKGLLDPDASALNYIFCHPWHSRIWTVQEATYSQACQVVCGKSSIPWGIYSTAARFLVFEEFIEQLDPNAHKSYIGIDLRNVIRDYLRNIPSSNLKPSPEDEEDERDRRVVFLSSCLSDVNQLQATEPKDKIFGIHALYTDLGIPLPPVNYENSLSRVYEEAAVAMITWSRTLKVLGDACHNHRNTAFPSWVPDWSDGNIKIFTPSGDATGGSQITETSSKTLNPRRGELHVQGKVIGTVLDWEKNASVTALFPTHPEQCEVPILNDELDGPVQDTETLRLWIEKTSFFRQLHNLLQGNPDICQVNLVEETFLDLLNQDSYSEADEVFSIWLDILKYPDTKYNLSLGETLVESWKAADESTAARWTTELTNCAVIMASLLANSVQHGDGRVLSHTPEILDLINQFSANLADKTLILAQLDSFGKTFLGTSIRATVARDCIVLLRGAEWPIVLRQSGRKWRLVGPAFVNGIMDGEAWSNESGQVHGIRNFALV